MPAVCPRYAGMVVFVCALAFAHVFEYFGLHTTTHGSWCSHVSHLHGHM